MRLVNHHQTARIIIDLKPFSWPSMLIAMIDRIVRSSRRCPHGVSISLDCPDCEAG